jgi:hypothetical protein
MFFSAQLAPYIFLLHWFKAEIKLPLSASQTHATYAAD